MLDKLAAFFIGAMLSCTAQAANWYVLKGFGTADEVSFFDRDSAVKQSEGTTLWIMSIKSDRAPERDGSYSTAIKWRADCKKQTMQILAMVSYDKDQALLRHTSTPSSPFVVAPETMGEKAMNTVCAPDFLGKRSKRYFAVPDNDVYAYAKQYFSIAEARARK